MQRRIFLSGGKKEILFDKNFNKANKLPVWLHPAAQIAMLRV